MRFMKSRKEKSFLHRVREKLHEMHPTERRLAEFVLTFPGEIASYSASELARLANVSNATVSRFIQRLGYTNYDEARRHVRSDQESGAAIFRVVSPSDGPEQILHAHQYQAHVNIDRTLSTITLPQIDALVQAMMTARKVWIIGFRSSHSFATYLHWQVLQILEGVVVLPQAGHTMAEHVAGIEPKDCVIVFGLRRQIATFDTMMDFLVKTGASVALIADSGSVSYPGTSWHFQCQTASAGPLYDHGAVIALTHLIATRVVELSGPTRRRRLSTIETIHDLFDEI